MNQEKDTEPAPLTDELKQLRNRVSQLEAARIGYASEFPLTADGEPDVGNIHANIRALKAKATPAAPVQAIEQSPLHWLPIEQAPTDGTELLLTTWTPEHGYGHVDFGSWGFIENSDYDGSEVYGWLSNYGDIDEPTHFINLAAPVQASQAQAAEVRAQALREAADEVLYMTMVPNGLTVAPCPDMQRRANLGIRIAAAIRALAAPSTADSGNTSALGEGADRD